MNTGPVQEPPQEIELDYRMSLAAERTYLAYARTGLALIAAGVAVTAALPGLSHSGLRHVAGGILILLGTTVALYARVRWQKVDHAMRRGEPLPPSRVGMIVTVSMGIVGIFALLIVFLPT